MSMFCKLGLHWWRGNGVWAGRKCKNCHSVEVLYYDKESGNRWVKVE
jgi:hypothetical protein